MKDTDNIKNIFLKAEIEYPVEEMKQTVEKRLIAYNNQVKRRRHFFRIGIVGLGCTILLCFTYIFLGFNSDTESALSSISPVLVTPVLLVVIAFQLEIRASLNTQNSL